jgi:hypothetical protein
LGSKLETPKTFEELKGITLLTFTKTLTPTLDEILESSSPPHTHTLYPTSLVLRFRILRALQETGEAWPP